MRFAFSMLLLASMWSPMSTSGQNWDIPNPEPPPWSDLSGSSPSTVVTTWQGQEVRGIAHMRMGQDDVFDKPVLLIEGFDFGPGWNETLQGYGSVNWGTIFGADLVNFPQASGFRPMLDSLHIRGADLIFLDFEHGTHSIEKKTALTRWVMQRIREQQLGNSPAVVVGVSMGGVVGRRAIAQWEQTQDDGHCIGQFFSLDAPHEGAVIPRGLQALISGLAAHGQEALDMMHALGSDAATQLLKNHLWDPTTHLESQASLQDLGWPEQCLNLAVVNSRADAVANLSDDPLLHMEWGWFDFLPSPFVVHASRWHPSETLQAYWVLPNDLNPFNSALPLDEQTLHAAPEEEDLESIPGSTSNHMQLLVTALGSAIPLPLVQQSYQDGMTFVPFSSALASQCQPSPWADISLATPTSSRESHASLGLHHRNWVLEWMDGLWSQMPEQVGALGEVEQWTMGWHNPKMNVLHAMEIQEQGTLIIGTSQDVFLAKTSSCPGEVLVKDAGALHIGQPSQLGELQITAGTEVHIGEEGKLEIHSGSVLRILDGAQLTATDGWLVLHAGAKLVVEPGGILTLNDGALMSSSAGSSMEVFGNIRLSDGSDALVEWNGGWHWKPNSSLHLGEGASFRMNCEDASSMTFAEQVGWSGEGLAKVREASMDWLPGAMLTASCRLDLDDCEMIASLGQGPHITSSQRVQLSHCEIGMVQWWHQGGTESGMEFKADHNEWTEGDLKVSEASFHLWDNVFQHAPLELSDPYPPARLTRNTFESAWFQGTPSVVAHGAEAPIVLEENTWVGGNGLDLQNSLAVAACNVWSDCNKAVTIDDSGPLCMVTACGGGGNRMVNNKAHFALNQSALPLLSGGNNFFGNVEDHFAFGSTVMDLTEWMIEEVEWSTGLLPNPWMGEVPGQLLSCPDENCQKMNIVMGHRQEQTECGGRPTGIGKGKKKSLSRRWNNLGQWVKDQSP